jgi:hypothetical protein
MHGLAVLVVSLTVSSAGEFTLATADKRLYVTHRRDVFLPVQVDPTAKAQLKVLKLYVSRDGGKRWEFAQRISADESHFRFKAAEDGIHYFAVQTTDKTGTAVPSDLRSLRAGVRVLVMARGK